MNYYKLWILSLAVLVFSCTKEETFISPTFDLKVGTATFSENSDVIFPTLFPLEAMVTSALGPVDRFV